MYPEVEKVSCDLAKVEPNAKKHRSETTRKTKSKREMSEWHCLPQSAHARNTVNPVRRIADAMCIQPNPEKSVLRLNLGDPTVSGELPPAKETLDAMVESVMSHKHDGYGPAVGELAARQAVAEKYGCAEAPLTADDVVLASGASHALQMAIEALADEGDNILVPHPGFPLYSTLCRPHGVEDRAYRLDMSRGAICDLAHMETLIDERTKAIIVNNPGNPTGTVMPKEHLQDVLKLADKYRVPIIADEIYGDMVYEGAVFYPMASLSPKVPVLSCDGIAKRWLVPGWRLGWITIHDRHNAFADVRKGIVSLSQKIVGPCALVQGALPNILKNTPQSFFDRTTRLLSANASVCLRELDGVPGLAPLRPQGAMYMMIALDESLYGPETPFLQALLREESVNCLPGTAFNAPGWIRLVLSNPESMVVEACQRLKEFAARRLAAHKCQDEGSCDEGCVSNTDSE